ncbi:endonuclease/exonuclease/phosphatase family protein [Nocardioides perillae]|uniref:Endonuclease/exonuclease/phosphatase family metal-dependent hydrolase n=1 Tax=Nocardioides perillae TaxID=1119534 RepID=A0A7Y9RTT4_9ACTN|nr:endonuclease/exonuclease/phosphatase family metal-dependent hydrolase [Nocardioides perillae]
MKQQQALTAAVVVGLLAVVATLLALTAQRGSQTAGPTAPTPTVSPAPSGTAPAPTALPAPTATPSGPPTAPPGSPSPVAPDQVCATGAATGPRRLRVLTFNIHAGLGGGRLQLGRVAEEIAATGADVVFLQEVDRFRARSGRTDQPALLAQRLGMEVAFGSNVRHPRGGQYGTAILSRWPIVDQRNLALPNRPGLEQRGLLFAAIDVEGTPLHAYGTHLQHTRGPARLEQMQAALQVIAADPVPKVFAGDFNAGPASAALQVARRYLADPWPVVGDGPGLTVPPRAPRRRIDYVLHDFWSTPVAARTVRSQVSDHIAVQVDLDLRTLPTCLAG